MNSQVVAAFIAASVSILTLIGTLAAQYFGRRATSRDTEKTPGEQGKHLDRTLAEQREQLDSTLAEQRTRTLNERFATAADQLGSDKPAVRLAGVYAMAGLADDWEEYRQTCVDVLCAYLRMPYEPDPGQEAPEPQRLAFQAAVSWQGLNFDFTGVVFDGGYFSSAQFSGGTVSFVDARFSGGTVLFGGAEFSSGTVDFSGAEFSGGEVSFGGAEFSGGEVSFYGAKFSGSTVDLGADFSGSEVSFGEARFSSGTVDLGGARFSGGTVSFLDARFSGGRVSFFHAGFSGGTVDFGAAEFSGGEVDFSSAADWSHPPEFDWEGTPPQA